MIRLCLMFLLLNPFGFADNLESLSLAPASCKPRCAQAGEDIYHPQISCGKGKALCCDNQAASILLGKYICPKVVPACKPRCAKALEDINHPQLTCGQGKVLCCDNQAANLLQGKFICPKAVPACKPRCAKALEDINHPQLTCGQGKVLCCDNQAANLLQGKFICPKKISPPAPPAPSPSVTPSGSNDTRPAVGAQSGKYKLLFVDYFQNLSQWTTETGLDTYTNTCAAYVKENVTTGPGGLSLKVGPKTDNAQGQCCRGSQCSDTCILSGRVASNFSKKYGVFIFKAKVPKGPDLFPALWLTGVGDWPKTGEYDLMETVDTAQARSDFTSRVMIPISSDFTLDSKAKQYYVGVSVPPDDQPDDKIMVTNDFWQVPHVFALDWYETADGDVKYDVYVDVKMENGMLVNLSDNQKAAPKKAYSLRDLVNKYKDYDCKCGWPPKYNLAAFEKIRDALKPHRLVMNIAVGGAWNGKKAKAGGCSNKKCGGCDQINDAMVVEYVQVWDKF